MSPVVDNTQENRFETETPAGTAVLQYRRSGRRLILDHTEVPEAAREHGTGGRLVEAAFLQARDQDLKVVPRCPYVRAWIEEHPEVMPLVEDQP